MAELPLAPVKRIITNAGAERVSGDAVELFAEHLEEQAMIISENAVKLAKHANRKTVKEDDIRLSVKTLYDQMFCILSFSVWLIKELLFDFYNSFKVVYY